MYSKYYYGEGGKQYRGGGVVELVSQGIINKGKIDCDGDEYSSGGI